MGARCRAARCGNDGVQPRTCPHTSATRAYRQLRLHQRPDHNHHSTKHDELDTDRDNIAPVAPDDPGAAFPVGATVADGKARPTSRGGTGTC